MRRSRALAAGLLALVLALTGAAAALAQDRLVVGVRTDARPFSFHLDREVQGGAGRPAQLGFDGYMIQVCEEVLAALEREHGIAIATEVVDAADRFDALDSGRVHILCDPATIVPDRLARALASPPVYMSAVTFAAPEPLPNVDICHTLVGLVSETTATHGVEEIERRGGWPRNGRAIRDALNALAAGREMPVLSVAGTDCAAPVIRFYDTHWDLAADFCAGRTLFYVGDVEIIRAMIELAGCAEARTVKPAVYSDERYAIFAALPGAGVPSDAILTFLAELSRRIHDVGTDPAAGPRSLLVRVFERINDRNYRASEKLGTFFWSLTGDFPGR